MKTPRQSRAGFPDLTELWRVAELCLPGHEECGALTFHPCGEGTLTADWRAWLAGIRARILRDVFLGVCRHASDSSIAALLGADAALGLALPAQSARASLTEGRRALLEFTPPRGAKTLERLRDAASSNQATGHMATVFAARAQAFHIPAVQAEMSLVLAECLLGAASVGVTLPAPRSVDLMAAAFSVVPASALLVAV